MSLHARLLMLIAAVAVAGGAAGLVRFGDGPSERPEPATAALNASGLAADLQAVGQGVRRLAEQRRRARLRVLRQQPTVDAALERAVLRRELPRADYRRARRTVAQARRLAAAGAWELGAALGNTRALAAAGRLTVSRIAAEILTLRRNVQAARSGRLPGDRERLTFPGDPLVYEHYAGQGLQIQWLGSWGKANWTARRCLESSRACPRRRLGAAIDRLVALASSRDGYPAWEYRFAFGGGSAPWVSALAQATAAQALARAGRVLREPRYRRLARAAIGAFARPAPVGVAAPAPAGGVHYLMYSFAPDLRILNGHIQALVALHDVATLAGGRRARRLFALGEREGATRLRAYDTGAWSLYSAGGAESSLDYHRLVAGFLENLCRRAASPAYCDAGRRFARYEHEPPRLALRLPDRPRVRRPVTLRFDLSKVSFVDARAEGPTGAALLAGARLPHGDHELRWVPPRPGRYRIVIGATDLAGNPATISRRVRVRPTVDLCPPGGHKSTVARRSAGRVVCRSRPEASRG